MFNENLVAIEALFGAGANPKAQDMDGKTPWDYAQKNIYIYKLKGINVW